MNVVTHALLPAIVAAPFLGRMEARGRYRAAATIALAGALPDLLHPHLSLASRYASWSHSVWALAGLVALVVSVSVLARGWLPWPTAIAAVLAFAAHLALDAGSGGLAWLYPAARSVIGARLVPFHWWILGDAAALLLAAAIYWPRGGVADRQERALNRL